MGLKHLRPRLTFAAGETHQTGVKICGRYRQGKCGKYRQDMYERQTESPLLACTVGEGGGLAAMFGRRSGVIVGETRKRRDAWYAWELH